MGHKLIFEQDWKPWPKDPKILAAVFTDGKRHILDTISKGDE